MTPEPKGRRVMEVQKAFLSDRSVGCARWERLSHSGPDLMPSR
jgi:hypothetical protein